MVLDSNILIAALDGDQDVIRALTQWHGEGRALFISTISLAEVLAFPSLDTEMLKRARAFLYDFRAIAFDEEIADTCARLERQYRLKLPDAAIAATTITLDVPLVTRDRQFQLLPELSIVAL